MHDRANEDPVSAILSALNELAEKASSMDRRLMGAFYLLLVWLIFAVVLWVLSIISLTPFDIISYAVLIVIVLVTMLRLVDIRESLARVIRKYEVYRFIESADLSIPEGVNAVERFLNYLNRQYDFQKILSRKNGKIYRNLKIGDVSFDVYAEIKPGVLRKGRGYSLYVVSVEHADVKTLRKICEHAKNNSRDRGVELSRIVVLARSVGDDAYEYVTSGNIEVPLQIVVEMDDGTYDCIPFIAPRPDHLP
ncbi:MAG: hypothetical protein GXO25_01420 [Euryarchaeota archaeon]|nr:hypothetical protein [Euryarchaeota archaeon]